MDLIIYEITGNFSSRRDLALTYYPSKLECFWFTSRTLTILRDFYKKAPLPLKVPHRLVNLNMDSLFFFTCFISFAIAAVCVILTDFYDDAV